MCWHQTHAGEHLIRPWRDRIPHAVKRDVPLPLHVLKPWQIQLRIAISPLPVGGPVLIGELAVDMRQHLRLRREGHRQFLRHHRTASAVICEYSAPPEPKSIAGRTTWTSLKIIQLAFPLTHSFWKLVLSQTHESTPQGCSSDEANLVHREE